MKVKTQDKIAYLVKKVGGRSSYWKTVFKENPKLFNEVFERAKKGEPVKLSNGTISFGSVLPAFASIDFVIYAPEEKKKHEALINETSLALLNYIEKFNLIGACMTIPYFYKMFLHELKIPIDVEYGVFELNGRFSAHSWNKYDGKIIDLTAGLQKDNVSGDTIVLDKIIKAGKDSFVYHRADRLPQEYLQIVEQMALREKEILDLGVKNYEFDYCKEMLDTDAFLCKALRENFNSCSIIESKYLPYLANEHKHFTDNYSKQQVIKIRKNG